MKYVSGYLSSLSLFIRSPLERDNPRVLWPSVSSLVCENNDKNAHDNALEQVA